MRARPRLTIPRRVFLAFALFLTVSGLVSVASLVQHQRTAATLSLLQEGYLPLALTISESRATQSVFSTLLERLLSERETRSTRAWLNAGRRVRPASVQKAFAGISKIEGLAPPASERATLARLRRELKRIDRTVREGEARYEKLFEALDGGDKEAAERILADLRARERVVESRLRGVWTAILDRIESVSTTASKQQEQAIGVLLALVILALSVGVGVTFWSQRVLSPLPKLQERVEAVARGDLARKLGPTSDDEIGRLTQEFERMVAALAARDQSLREASASLRALQRMQAQILSDLSAAVIVVDGAGLLVSSNPAADALFELDADAVGKPLGRTRLLSRLPELDSAMQEVRQGAERAILSEVTLDADSERMLNGAVTPFGPDPTAERGGVLIVAEDVTEELRTKSRLIQSERLAAIGRMAAHVTHEVRNPLSSIGLNVEMLEDELEQANDDTRALLSAIQREIEHLRSITEEYLRVARLPNPALEPEYVGDALQSAVSFLGPELEAGGVRLQVDVEPDLPLVALDEGQFRQVLINLLKNAREAMPDGGRVTLVARKERGGVVLRVVDEGPGMGEEQRARIFDLFFTTKKLGSGLGLPLTQQIVIAHGGTIRCDSAPGRGTVFELWFPAAELDRGAEADVALMESG